jgi:fatty-acid desaturase
MFAVSARSLIIYQVIAHSAFTYALFYGTLGLWAAAIVLYLIFTTVGGTVTFHRLVSHRSFDCSKWFEYVGSLIGSLGGNGSPLAWAAVHREHHRFTDTKKDPHSPLFKSIFSIHFAAMTEKPNLRYVPDLLRSKFHTALHQYYWAWNLLYIFLVFILFGVNGILFGYFVPTLLVWHAGSSINTLNHMSGYKNHKLDNYSTNNKITGYLVSGEGWHNNHHAQPANPNFGEKSWEFDLGYQLIRLVQK